MSLPNLNEADDLRGEDMEELLNIKEEWVDMIISSFTEDRDLPQLIETVKKAIKILPTYEEVVEVEEEVLKIILPIIKEAIYSTCEENEIISKSLEHSIQLQTNLQLTIKLLESLNKILDYLMHFKQVEACHLQSVPINLGQVIYRTFQHCKSCQKLSDNIISSTLELFKKTQDVHIKYLAWLDTCMAFNLAEQIDVNILKEDMLCHISSVLSGMNWKSITDNWKGYSALSQKYCELLGVQFNSSLPIQCLTNEIQKSLSTVVESGPNNVKLALQNIKLVGFILKVALRLFESYWTFIESCLVEVIHFLTVVYSYQCGYFHYCQFPEEFVDVVRSVVFVTIDPFIKKFLNERDFFKYLINSNKIPENKLGFIGLTNSILNHFPSNIDEKLINELKINCYIQSIFDCIKDCYYEFFLCDSIFYEEFISNIATTVLRFPQYYSDVEKILISGVLQERVWLALVSIDVWCLILRNCPNITVIETLHGLISIIEELDFGLFSPRPEQIFLKTLMHRILSFIPSAYKNELFNKYNSDSGPHVGKFLKLDVSNNPICLVEEVANKFLLKTNDFGLDSDFKTLTFMVENLDIISNINFEGLNYRNVKLVEAICKLWSYNYSEDLTNNNFFKYFISKLCKASAVLMEELNDKNVVLILQQMSKISSEPFYKLMLLLLIPQCKKRTFEMNTSIESLLQSISSDKNPIISHAARPFLDQQFKNKSNVDHHLTETTNFLKHLNSYTFDHKCLQWQYGSHTDKENFVIDLPQFKKIKLDNENHQIRSEPDFQQKIKRDDGEIKKVKSYEIERRKKHEEKVIANSQEETVTDEDVSTIINCFKSDVKKLGKVLKKTNLTKKQAAEISSVIRSLESYLN